VRIIILIALLLTPTITEGAINEKQAIHCIMGEARGEGKLGMQAVGEVLRRRGTTKGMYGCKAKFREPKWVYDMAESAWTDSETSNLTNGATHFESTDFPVPYWADSMRVVAKLGKHIFYKER
jgi:spore germination cell wall hydrolase CwlJ-like protein